MYDVQGAGAQGLPRCLHSHDHRDDDGMVRNHKGALFLIL